MAKRTEEVNIMPEKLNDLGTIALAAAIINSADREHDTTFFESDWYETLYNLLLYAPSSIKKSCNVVPKVMYKKKSKGE